MSLIADIADEPRDDRAEPMLVQRDAGPDRAQVIAALDRILRSRELRASPRQQRLLVYIVEETLAGRGSRLKAYTLATAVLGRNEHFNAQTDPVVRIEVGQLRRCLERYYLTAGGQETVRIEIPKGAYAAHFHETPVSEGATPPVRGPEANLSHRSRSRRAGRYVPAAIALALASLVLSLFYDPVLQKLEDMTAGGSSRDLAIDRPIIQIDEFTNAGGDPKLDAFAAALSGDAVRELARFKSLQFVLGDLRNASPAPIDYRLSGSVSRMSDGILVSAQLRDGRIGSIVLTKTFAIAATALDKGREQVAGQLATAVGDPFGQLAVAERQRTAQSSRTPMALRQCLLTFYEYEETEQPDTFRRVRDCHEQAATIVPNSSAIWSNLAFLYVDEYRFGYAAPAAAPPALHRAVEAAKRAALLDPADSHAHLALALAYWFQRDVAASMAESDLALTLNPNDPMVLGEIGTRRFILGDWADGYALVNRALSEGSGRPAKFHYVVALYAYMHGDYGAALDAATKGGVSQLPLARAIVASIYGMRGQRDEANAVWTALAETQPALAKAPRAVLALRNWDPKLVDALMAGLDKAGIAHD